MSSMNYDRGWAIQRISICAEFGRKLDDTSCFMRNETQAQLEARKNLVNALNTLIEEDASTISGRVGE